MERLRFLNQNLLINKHAKLKSDLEIVIQNIVLTNEMIDAHEPDQEVDENDALLSWAQSLRSFETKLVELIEKIKNDEVMHLALMVNDDLLKTLKRYKKVEHGRAAESFKPEWRKYLPGYRDETEKPKPKPQAKPQAKPAPAQKVVAESAPKVVKVEKPKAAASAKPPVHQPTEEDIFGFNESSEAAESKPIPVSVKSKPQAVSSSADDLFGVSFNDTPSSTNNQLSGDSNINKLNDIMSKMTIQPKQAAMPGQFSTAAPGMGPGIGPGMGFGGPGMGPMGPPMGPGIGFGGPGMGPMGPPMGFAGPSPGMFHTGMPGGMYPGMGGGMGMMGPDMGTGFGGFNQPSTGFGGGFGGDAFSKPVFSTGAANYNKGGGPEAFKKQKKVEKGPKEFTELFSMANKISDRKNQPANQIDDYVTAYKNNNEGMDMNNFGYDNYQEVEVNEYFMGDVSTQPAATSSMPNSNVFDDPFAGSDSYAGKDQYTGSDPFGNLDHMYGDSEAPMQNSTGGNNDIFGGMSNEYGAFSGADSNGMSQNEAFNAFNGSGNVGADKSKQDELFDIFN